MHKLILCAALLGTRAFYAPDTEAAPAGGSAPAKPTPPAPPAAPKAVTTAQPPAPAATTSGPAGDNGAVAVSKEASAAGQAPTANIADSTAASAQPPPEPKKEEIKPSSTGLELQLGAGRKLSNVIDLGTATKAVDFTVEMGETELPPGAMVRLGFETARDPGFYSHHAATSQARTAGADGKVLGIKIHGNVVPAHARYLRVFAVTSLGEGEATDAKATFKVK